MIRLAEKSIAMAAAQVRQTYAGALKKHLKDNPDDTVYSAHAQVLGAHPTLAKSLRKKPATDAAADDSDDDAGVTATANSATAKANERTSLANSYEFTDEEKATAREAIALANDASRTDGAPRAAMVQTARGWVMAGMVVE
jgi:hypothetical protein